MKCLALGVVILLGGCAAQMPQREAEVKTVYVNVPTPVSCVIAKPKRPEFVDDKTLKAMAPEPFVLSLWADRLQRRDYIAEIEAVLQACEGVQR